eukprot:354830-Chlamydomonas_euryale.AAC.2
MFSQAVCDPTTTTTTTTSNVQSAIKFLYALGRQTAACSGALPYPANHVDKASVLNWVDGCSSRE